MSGSWNFNHSRKENETFDVATYGPSANGIEGDPARINVMNLNWFTTLSSRMVNEAHFTYSRESRPRTAVGSGLAADTGMGFGPSFRFGDPFFLQPNVDELIWRTQLKDNVSIVTGKHTFKVGGEWMHTLNDQVFRGFFTGRYLFGSVAGFLRYASPAAPGGFGPNTVGCSNGVVSSRPRRRARRASTTDGGPLLFYLQGAGRTGPATDAAGASVITNDEFSLFAQDSWQVRPNLTLNYGLRWDSQRMPETVDPRDDRVWRRSSNDPTFPSDGTIPSQWSMWQPRVGVAWDVKGDGTSLVRASWGVYYARQNMLSQVGSVTTNGLQQQTIFANTAEPAGSSARRRRRGPNVVTPDAAARRAVPALQRRPRLRPRLQEPARLRLQRRLRAAAGAGLGGYVDFIWNEGNDLTRFLNYNRSGPVCCDVGPGTGNSYAYTGHPWRPQLDEVMVTNSRGAVALPRR